MRYNLSKYLLALALAELPYAVGTVYLGSSLVEQRTVMLASLAAAVAVFSAWTFHTPHQRLARHAGTPDPD